MCCRMSIFHKCINSECHVGLIACYMIKYMIKLVRCSVKYCGFGTGAGLPNRAHAGLWNKPLTPKIIANNSIKISLK